MAVFKFSRISQQLPNLNTFNRFLSTANRPIAALDEVVQEKLTEPTSSVNIRKHPGVFTRGVIRLPEDLETAAKKVISDKSESTANLFLNAQKLYNHLAFKKPPLSEGEVFQLKNMCKEKFTSSYPLPDTTYMSAADEKRIENSYSSKIRKIINQTAYNWKPVTYNQSAALAYLVARLCPDYASLSYIFKEIKQRDQSFQPTTLFDFGSGVGSSLWAAKGCWSAKKIKEVFCVDSSIDMNNLALALLQGGVWPNNEDISTEENTQESKERRDSLIKGLYFRQFMPSSAAVKFDLVVCAHSLLELPSAELRLQTVLSLWRKSQGYLVLVEQGSRAAYEVVMEARDFLLSLSNERKEGNIIGHVFSPCPHNQQCPRLGEELPCNFEVTYEPLFPNKRKSNEREKFTYVVLKKGPRPSDDPQWPRAIQPVLARSGHTVCRLCTKEGSLAETVITRAKHSRLTNQCARHTRWGDLLPVQLSSKENPTLGGESSHVEDHKTES